VPTKRRKIPPQRINEPTPLWGQRMLAGHGPPAEHEDGFDGYFDWLFLGRAIAGLPDAESEEGYRLWQRSDGS
jgi:hypothetical protein